MTNDDSLHVKYPPRGSWDVVRTYRIKEIYYRHNGYRSKKLKPCPVCGRYPVFEEDQYRSTAPDERAKYFYGYCPTCDLRTRESGTLKDAVYQWQRGEYSDDSFLFCHRPSFVKDNVDMLCKKIVEAAIDDAIMKVKWRQQMTPFTGEWRRLGTELDQIERFFRESVFSQSMDPDGIISEIRRAVYPDMSAEERMLIPLKLSSLYEGQIIHDSRHID